MATALDLKATSFSMRSRMHPKYYLSQDIFEREQEKIFRRVWVFATVKTLLPEHNSFVTRKIAGIPVVIQNFEGELRAYENVCLHRNALIQTEPVGKRPLACKYHAWRYDSNGHVANIPDRDTIYRLKPEQCANLRLREFALRVVGNVIFINLDKNPIPFEEQFPADFIATLEESSSMWDTEVLTTTWHGKFNWKLAYENLRDGNHPRFVHPRSLAKTNDYALAGVDEAQFTEAQTALPAVDAASLREEMRRFSYGNVDATIPNLQQSGWRQNVERWRDDDVYYTWLAYPNLHISTPAGFSFTLEHHIPVAPDRTDVEIFWFTARKKKAYAQSSQVLLESMHGSKRVVGEDIEIMEAVQAALHQQGPVPTLGAYESMNMLVERWYTLLMDSDHGV
jgi:carnitine monooxygenase subunit